MKSYDPVHLWMMSYVTLNLDQLLISLFIFTRRERDGSYYIWSYTGFKKLILVIQQLSLLSFAATRTHRSFLKWIIARQVCNSRKMCPKSMHHGIAEATVYEVPSFIAQTCIKRSLSDEVYQIWFWGNGLTIQVIRID